MSNTNPPSPPQFTAEQALREQIIHGLRKSGWPRIEAEGEADERIERRRTKDKS